MSRLPVTPVFDSEADAAGRNDQHIDLLVADARADLTQAKRPSAKAVLAASAYNEPQRGPVIA